MSKLQKYASSSELMNIRIKYEKEIFKFNLFDEIKIKESHITEELISQVESYGFLTMLHKSLLKTLSDKKIEERKAYNSAYIKWKRQLNPDTSRPYSDDLAKANAEMDKKYEEAQKITIEINFDFNRVDACVKAFEQRKDILQTLSANRRRERE